MDKLYNFVFSSIISYMRKKMRKTLILFTFFDDKMITNEQEWRWIFYYSGFYFFSFSLVIFLYFTFQVKSITVIVSISKISATIHSLLLLESSITFRAFYWSNLTVTKSSHRTETYCWKIIKRLLLEKLNRHLKVSVAAVVTQSFRIYRTWLITTQLDLS